MYKIIEKFEKKYKDQASKYIEEISQLEQNIKKPSEAMKDKKELSKQLIKLKWKIFIEKYLIYANDFIGRDLALLKNSTVKSFSRENRHTSPAFATKNKNLVWFISLN